MITLIIMIGSTIIKVIHIKVIIRMINIMIRLVNIIIKEKDMI